MGCMYDYFKIAIYSEEVHTPAPDFFELKPVLRPGQVQAVDESRSERSPLHTLWRKDVPGDGAYYKNKPFHQETYYPPHYFYFPTLSYLDNTICFYYQTSFNGIFMRISPTKIQLQI